MRKLPSSSTAISKPWRERRGRSLAFHVNDLARHQRPELVDECPPGKRFPDPLKPEDLGGAQQNGSLDLTGIERELHLVEQAGFLLGLVQDRRSDRRGQASTGARAAVSGTEISVDLSS
jgi:hypothetical protein